MSPNRPDVVAALRDAFERYEQALGARDLDALADAFDPTETVVRFGVDDRQQGARELARWRATQPAPPPGRELADTVISTWGECVGVVTTHFRHPGRPKLGRQSQTWLCEDDRWRIVSAHVSEIEMGAPT